MQGGDAQALTRLPGVGRKTAERLVVEMRDRLGAVPSAGEPATSVPGAPEAIAEAPADEAVRALVSLGYKEPVALRMVRAVAEPGLRSEDLIRLALKKSLS